MDIFRVLTLDISSANTTECVLREKRQRSAIIAISRVSRETGALLHRGSAADMLRRITTPKVNEVLKYCLNRRRLGTHS